jgi:hypothetical protein
LKTAFRAPRDSRFMTEATSGMSRLRNTTMSRRKRQEHDHGDERRELVGEHVGEVDVGGRHPADVDDQAGAVLGPGDEVMAEVVHQVDGLAGLRAGGLWAFFRRAAV